MDNQQKTEGLDTAELVKSLQGIKSLGRYEIDRKLGQGASGVVFLGRDPYIRRPVAIKISQPTSQRSRERFFVEAQSAGRLNHPGIVGIYDLGIYNELCYITMEYVDGDTLEKYCRPDGLLTVRKAVETIFSACTALDFAHSNKVIHRDIKPSNIMLDSDGSAKITDFGIAQMTEQTSEMGIWGTPSYMSPEQLKDEMIRNNSDIFSMGCVLYELLTGQQAFPGNNNFSIMYKITNDEPVPLLELRPELPLVLEEIIRKSLHKDPDQRYQGCADLAFDLRVALRGLNGVETRDEKVRSAIDYVHHVPFFQNFSKEQVEQLGTAATIAKVPQGGVIVAEGDIDDTFYIILSGRARILRGEQSIATIGVGECFGEMAYIAALPRTASVLAKTDCILMKISATLIDRSPDSVQLLFYKNFARTLVQRLAKS